MIDTVTRLHSIIADMLAQRGDRAPIMPDESLFVSGRLDSLAATEMIIVLESEFGIDVSSPDFDVAALDTLADMERLVTATRH